MALVALGSWIAVDETQFAIVTEFGRPVAVYGDAPGEAGFHAKWPWQSTLTIDRRLQVSEPPAREVITSDKRNLEVAPYVAWRVADPVRFLTAAGSLESASARLDERVASAINDAMGGMTLENLASTEPGKWKLDDLTSRVLDALAGPVREELGVEVVDVRLRRFNHPLEVRPAVFDLIRSERKQEAARLRAEGDAEYRKITSQADRERDEALARADAEAERIRARGEAEATRILNAAHARDPRFYEFLRTLETYRSVLDGQATVVLSAASPLLRLLAEGPTEALNAPPDSPTGTPGSGSASPGPHGVAGSPASAEGPER
jgi:membrane protease subunit HflC